MRHRLGIFAVAIALAVPAHAQNSDGKEDAPPSSLSRQVEIFRSEAGDAEAKATVLEEQAKRTRDFVARLRQQLSTLAVEDQPDVIVLIDGLENRVVVEEQQAEAARVRAEGLKKKADLAAAAVEKLPDIAVNEPAETAAVAFGKDFDQIFLDPNEFYPPTAAGKVEEGATTRRTNAPEEVARGLAARVARAASAFLFDRPEATPISGASLSLAEDGTRLGLKFAFVRGGKYLKCPADSNGNCQDAASITGDEGYQSTWAVGISSEANKKFANLFSGGDDGGFDDNIRANLGYTRTVFHERSYASMRGQMAEVPDALQTKCQLAKREADPLISNALLITGCSGDQLYRWAYRNEDATVRKTVLDALWGYGRPDWKWGASAEAGYKAFSYRNLSSVDPVELDSDQPFGRRLNEETEFVWQLSGHIGKFGAYYADTPHLYGALIAELGEEYDYAKTAKSQTICPVPTDPVAFTNCTDLNIAPPEKDTFYRVGFEGKVRVTGWSLMPELALVPKITFDLDDSQLGYELPILFVTDKDSKLNAGIKLAGETGGENPDDFSFGLFVSSAFSIE